MTARVIELNLPIALGRMRSVSVSSVEEHFICAAILFHAIPIDGVIKTEELDSLKRILVDDFELTDQMVDGLIETVERNDKRKSFFNEVIENAKNELSASQKRNLISQLWEVVFSDGHLHEAEGNLVLQVAIDIGIEVEEACSLMSSNQH